MSDRKELVEHINDMHRLVHDLLKQAPQTTLNNRGRELMEMTFPAQAPEPFREPRERFTEGLVAVAEAYRDLLQPLDGLIKIPRTLTVEFTAAGCYEILGS